MRFSKHLAIILSSIIIFTAYLSCTKISFAAEDLLSLLKGNASAFGQISDALDLLKPYKELEEFCQRRSGNQMNLETWYSGKCKTGGKLLEDKDTIMGEGVGFADIVYLDLYERIKGPQDPDKSAFKKLLELLASNDIKNNPAKFQQSISELNNSSGPAGSIANLATSLFTKPPATTTDYLAYIGKNLKDKKIIPSAYAAGPGVGFTGFAPILPIWKAIRNISYFLFAIMFIIYGFMIMFRVKIDPRTAVTIELALPQIVITLVMITFSYAIVGFMFDLTYVIYYLVFNLLSPDVIGTDGVSWFFTSLSSGRWGLIGSMFINNILASAVVPGAVVSMLLGGPAILGSAIQIVISFVIPGLGIIFSLIVALAVLITYLKTFWNLTVSYLTIILKLIFSPIILLGNLLPGSNTFQTWLVGMFADMSVFPVTMICFALSWVFMSQGFLEGIFTKLNVTGYVATPPIVGPMFSQGTEAGVLLTILGFALLIMSSKYANIIKDALKVPPFKYGDALGEALTWGYDSQVKMFNNDKVRAIAGAGKRGQERLKNIDSFNTQTFNLVHPPKPEAKKPFTPASP